MQDLLRKHKVGGMKQLYASKACETVTPHTHEHEHGGSNEMSVLENTLPRQPETIL